MVDVILAVVAVAVLVTVALGVLLAVTAVPFLVALGHAERRRASTARAGAGALAGSALGVGAALLAFRAGAGLPLAALPLAATWAAPVLVARAPEPARALGRSGRHERVLR